jgi:hypothetical protein
MAHSVGQLGINSDDTPTFRSSPDYSAHGTEYQVSFTNHDLPGSVAIKTHYQLYSVWKFALPNVPSDHAYITGRRRVPLAYANNLFNGTVFGNGAVEDQIRRGDRALKLHRSSTHGLLRL